jgi:hypothetical protein
MPILFLLGIRRDEVEAADAADPSFLPDLPTGGVVPAADVPVRPTSGLAD